MAFKTALPIGLSALLLLHAPLNYADVVTDGTVGDKVTLNGQSITIDQLLGMLKGGNLFHSFLIFDVNSGQTVTFTGADFIKNLIVRVTGDDVSHINGRLNSKVGQANFFLINPSGIVFGKGAAVNVPAGFHVSTADEIRLADGGVFSAAHPKTSVLTSGAPESFGFLGGNNAILKIDAANLEFKPGRRVSFIANNLQINNSEIIVEAGEIRLGAVGKSKLQVGIHSPSGANLRDTRFTGDMAIRNSYVSTEGNGGGLLSAQAGNLAIRDSWLTTANRGSRNNTKGVRIGVSGRFDLVRSSIDSSTFAEGDAGTIVIDAGTIRIDGDGGDDTAVQSNSYCAASAGGCGGNAGDVKVEAQGGLTVTNGGFIGSSTETQGNAGTVTVGANNLTVDGKGYYAGIGSSSSCPHPGAGCGGHAGDVNVNVRQGLSVLNGGEIGSWTATEGHAGDVNVEAGDIVVDGKEFYASIYSTSDCGKNHAPCGGAAGDVNVTAHGDLHLLREGNIESSTHTSGNAGNISVRANNISIDGKNYGTGIFSESFCRDASRGCGGDAGKIDVAAKNGLTLLNRGQIAASTYTSGNANKITVRAGNINIDGKGRLAGIYSISFCGNAFAACGDASHITVYAAQALNIFNRGEISSSTFTRGNAGNVNVTAKSITIDGNRLFTGIFSQSYRDGPSAYVGGNAGNVNVTAYNSLNLRDGGLISSGTDTAGQAGDITLKVGTTLNISAGGNITTSTDGGGNAGKITLQAGHVNIDGQGNSDTGLFSRAGDRSRGRVGNIAVDAGTLLIADSGQISIESDAQSSPLNAATAPNPAVTIHAGSVTLSHGGKINASSKNKVAASAIHIAAGNLTLNNAEITTAAENADGGPITIQSGLTQLTDSRITTSVSGDGNGGNISIAGKTLILDGGFIQANAAGENTTGGDINIGVETLIASREQLQTGGNRPAEFKPGFNVIQAASPDGVNGNINVTSPQLNINGQMLPLRSEFLAAPDLDGDSCTAGQGSKLLRAGHGGLPASPENGVAIPDEASGVFEAQRNAAVDETPADPRPLPCQRGQSAW
ncbi:MAG: two-partner secretion domain-containing protein [Gammaproteobacteria bacterium]